ncbi:hypothetical protein [Sinorhizobium sp. BJ1]|uniref:hypothetical protein n=1 Tax=Sinorhizobium sp. BJ1 TaxID=2035455 RepID=UPI001FE1B80C|nr:hypothetical protein [Sinorhizobium sp. BJ1]
MKSWLFRDKDDAGGWVEHRQRDPPDEPVWVQVVGSGLNYKDTRSFTRSAPISLSARLQKRLC